MARCKLRFHEGLKFFVPPAQREQEIELAFPEDQSIKHLIESSGVPHTEIGWVAQNGVPVHVDALPGDATWIDVYPPQLPVALPHGPRFVLDGHLGRLAAYLRMLGYDCWYQNHVQDAVLAEVSAQELRVLLTRDRQLLMRKLVTQGYCLRSLKPTEQLREVMTRYGLDSSKAPFQRCLRCNAVLEQVDKAQVLDRLQPLTRRYFDEFQRCPACDQIYWKGSHYERMRQLIASLKSG